MPPSPPLMTLAALLKYKSDLCLMIDHWLGGGGQAGGWPEGLLLQRGPAPSLDKEPSESYLPSLQHTWSGRGGPGLFLTSSPADPTAGRAEVWQTAAPDAESLSSHGGA